MNAAVSQVQNLAQRAHHELSKFKEESEMKSAMWMAKVNIRLQEIIAAKAPVKLLGGLALGSLLMAATVLPFSSTYADEPSKPLSIEQNQCYAEIEENGCTSDQLKISIGLAPSSSSETTEAFQSPAYWVQRDEAEEMLFEENLKSFIGVPAPASSETTQAYKASTYWAQRDDAEETLFDEMRQSFIGVPAPSSSETIQGFQDLAYWLQRDEAEEMAFDEARQALIGQPVSSERMKVFASVAELESLQPDTPYYRDPDYRDSEPGKGKVGSPSPVGIEAWGDLKPTLGSIDYLVHLGYDFDEDELDAPTLQLLLETANKQGMPQQVGAHD